MKVHLVIRYGYDENYEVLHAFNTSEKAKAKLIEVCKAALKENKHKSEHMIVNQFDTISVDVE